VRRGAAAESRGEPENPGIGLGDPERGVESVARDPSWTRSLMAVIPREGVESDVNWLLCSFRIATV